MEEHLEKIDGSVSGHCSAVWELLALFETTTTWNPGYGQYSACSADRRCFGLANS
jgi:hypothetical protein